jgi:hypothetical protein
MSDDRMSAIIGSVLGLSLSGYLLVYAPMRGNFEQCGRVTLCPSVRIAEVNRKIDALQDELERLK